MLLRPSLYASLFLCALSAIPSLSLAAQQAPQLLRTHSVTAKTDRFRRNRHAGGPGRGRPLTPGVTVNFSNATIVSPTHGAPCLPLRSKLA